MEGRTLNGSLPGTPAVIFYFCESPPLPHWPVSTRTIWRGTAERDGTLAVSMDATVRVLNTVTRIKLASIMTQFES